MVSPVASFSLAHTPGSVWGSSFTESARYGLCGQGACNIQEQASVVFAGVGRSKVVWEPRGNSPSCPRADEARFVSHPIGEARG